MDLPTHPRTHVSIRVAADFLDLDERTVRARIDAGHLRASQDGRRVRIPLESLAEYAKASHVPRSTAKHIEAMRMSERYGIGTLDQAFAGYAPRLQSSTLEWWLVLGVPPYASRNQVEAAYKAKARIAHPDAGGSAQEMARLNDARDHALRDRS